MQKTKYVLHLVYFLAACHTLHAQTTDTAQTHSKKAPVRQAKCGARTFAPVLCRYVPESLSAASWWIFPTCANTSASHPTGGPLKFDSDRCVKWPWGSSATALAISRVAEGSLKCCRCTERLASMDGRCARSAMVWKGNGRASRSSGRGTWALFNTSRAKSGDKASIACIVLRSHFDVQTT